MKSEAEIRQELVAWKDKRAELVLQVAPINQQIAICDGVVSGLEWMLGMQDIPPQSSTVGEAVTAEIERQMEVDNGTPT